MRKVLIIFSGLVLVVFLIGITSHYVVAQKSSCTIIKDGVLEYSAGHYLAGQPLKIGYDAYGYNYQAHMFNGNYANAYLGRDGFPPYEGDDETYLAENPGADLHWTWPYRNDAVMMKWNDAWMSKMDCGTQVGQAEYTNLDTPDGVLDRHYPIDSYIGSGAWLTNHMQGTYELDGVECHWTYFVKIVAAPGDATVVDGMWIAGDGTEIGPVIWGAFAVIQDVTNDKCDGLRGAQYVSPSGPGLGKF